MTTEAEFRPDEFGVEANDRGQFRLVWKRDTGEQRTVVLDREQLLAVSQEVQKQTELESVAPTDLEELLAGEVAQVTGLGFAPASDHFRLTAFVEVPEKEARVAISLRLSKADLKKCVLTMTQWLAQTNTAPSRTAQLRLGTETILTHWRQGMSRLLKIR